ncbi:MAG: hypothetical protein ACREIP_19010 [Alphaproteobacteria bacterium]
MRALAISALTSILLLAGVASSHAAEEGKVQAMAVLQGEGTIVHVGEKESMLVGVLEGVMFIATNKGPLHLAKMACPLRAMVGSDLNQSIDGRCLLSDADGNQVYAAFTCKGSHMEGCSGEFKLTGGSGKFKGITGSSNFVFRSTTQDLASEDVGVMSRKAIGLGVWPELNYRIP